MIELARLFSLLYLLAIQALGIAALYLPPVPSLPLPEIVGQVDRVVVEKAAHRMVLYQGTVPVRTYRIALGFAPKGDKERQGDGRTPEGVFRINRRNSESAYHLSLGLDYPQPEDRARAAKAGYSPGGDIMIHGQPNFLSDDKMIRGDWTAGCIALTNAQIQELWRVTGHGTIVEVRP